MDEQTQPQESKSIPTTTATEARLDEAKGSAKGKDFFKLVFVGFMFFCAGLQSLHYYAMQVTSYKGDDWGIAALFFWGVAGITIIITLVGIFFAKRRLAMLAFTFFGVLTLIPFPLYLENISQASL